ncbi:MAG TPA: response regulator [Sphingomonas sp.]|nr:response regulator [Sphingomonas sp.]
MNTGLSPQAHNSDRPRPDAPSTNGHPDRASSGLTVLLIDDNGRIAESLGIALDLAGHRVDAAAGPEEAFSRLATQRYDAILLDMNYTPGRTSGDEGLAVLSRILAEDPAACVIVITAHSGIRIAVSAMQAGARDFVMKPWRNAELIEKIEAAVAEAPTPVAATAPIRPAATEPARLLGDSAAIGRVRDLIARIGPTPAGVLVTGPSGSGRTLVAAALHAASPHVAQPIARIDLRDPAAWDRLAGASGTVVLRHPDRIDAVAQARLIDRLPPTVRPIAIADSAAAITPALARRIAAIEIAVPPLHDRGDDALLLARHFVRLAATRYGRPAPSFTAAAESMILDTRWTDDARGLAAAVERAALLSDGTIDVALLTPTATAIAVQDDAPRFDLDLAERAMIEAALREHHHNVTHAATALGLSRGALYRRMARHGL